MARHSTIADLAEKSGVSISTIDRVLNGRDPVRRATAEKVLAAAEEIGFYAVPLLRERLGIGRPVQRLGFLLQQSNRTFYRLLADALNSAARDAGPQVEVVVEHMDDLSPEAVSARMLEMGAKVEALAVVSAEHPRVTQAIETLNARGVPVFGLISGLTAACGVGYLGLDNWKVGRMSAWAIANLCRTPGKVGILVGNHRYRCQEMNESGFRSYFREHASDFQLLEPISTFEDRAIAREVTEALLQREPDLVGLYISGGGITGAMEAVANAGKAGKIVTVGYELMDPTRSGLMDGILTLVIAHPIARLAAESISAMCNAAASPALPPAHRLVSFDIFTAENL
jgi:LacI family transcriptional regulator